MSIATCITKTQLQPATSTSLIQVPDTISLPGTTFLSDITTATLVRAFGDGPERGQGGMELRLASIYYAALNS